MSLLASKPKTLSEYAEYDSSGGVKSENTSPESYGTLDDIVAATRKKRTRTNSQDGASKSGKRKKIKEVEMGNSRTSRTDFDSISTSVGLTCRLKRFRELRILRSINSTVSPYKSKEPVSYSKYSSILSSGPKSFKS